MSEKRPAPSPYTLKGYEKLGVDIKKLGCVMLDVERVIPNGVIPDVWGYKSKNPLLKHVDGIQQTNHITLKFGLLQNAHEILYAVDEALGDWTVGTSLVSWRDVDYFPSTIPGEEYSCIVLKVDSHELRTANARLSFLPHIDTHPTYTPHITVAYVKEHYRQETMDLIAVHLAQRSEKSRILTTLGMNYGSLPTWS